MNFDHYLQSAFQATLADRRSPVNILAKVAAIHSGDTVAEGAMREAILRSELFQVCVENGVWWAERKW